MIPPSKRTGNVQNLVPGRVNCETRAGAPFARDALILLFSSQVYSTRVGVSADLTAALIGSPDTVELGGTELGRYFLPFSAGSSKIKILTSLANTSKAS